MATTYETDNYKSGVMEIRGVKRIWVIDKRTGHFAKLKGNSPIYSEKNKERNLIQNLEDNGAEIEVLVKVNYERSGKNKEIMCEAHINGKYKLKGEEFLVVKEMIENHIRDDKSLMDLTEYAFNQAFGQDGMNTIPFDTFTISINYHKYLDSLENERFTTKLLRRGTNVECSDKEELSNRLREIIAEVIR